MHLVSNKAKETLNILCMANEAYLSCRCVMRRDQREEEQSRSTEGEDEDGEAVGGGA